MGSLGFLQTDFTFEPTSKFVHNLTEEFFDFGLKEFSDDDPSLVTFSDPGRHAVEDIQTTGFDHAIGVFGAWCTELRAYTHRVERSSTLPDLFTSASRQDSPAQALVLPSSLENTLLTPDERDLVSQRLGELESYIRESRELTTQQFQVLDGQIKYLAEASRRFGRKDWLNLLVSVLFSFVISGIFAPARAEELMTYSFALFQFLSKTGLLP